ncbi:HAD-IA family hydrolase [Microlunatus soli]|uniref:2-haloacid dehalogenase n=1 Tax=Microlunatus soli TaxID=630515 RepID=A0A1H2A5R2_9ACTN|nr:HAD-IA family hydrolase [Microlunatus soli]SDT41290.1 2-haloacid dehalogenase [Microlunatus soli]
MSDRYDTVVFDLGGVVLNWEPERAYQQVMPADQVGDFMDEICFNEWNHRHDAGQDWDEGEAELISRLPQHREQIEAYRRYFDLTITGMVPGTAAIIAELQRAGVRLVALTNWSADLFRPTKRRFGLLNRFEGIVVSGEEGIAKPDPQLFSVVFDRYQVDPEHAIFIDDNEHNCTTAGQLGLQAIPFTDAAAARSRLVELGLLGEREPVPGPIFHIAKKAQWDKAKQCGNYYWSTRRVTYEVQGFVHCAFPEQLTAVRERGYRDLADDELVVLRIDPAAASAPVIVEDDGTGEVFPHLYGALTPADVVEERPFAAVPVGH